MDVLFVHDPGIHFSHRAWGESVGADFLEYKPKNRYTSPIQAALRQSVVKKHYEVVVAEGGTCLPLAARLKKKLSAKLILLGEDAMFWELSRSPRNPRSLYLRRLVGQVDGLVAGSMLVKRYAKLAVNCPISVVHPAGRVETFGRFNPGLETKNIIFFGKHRPDKNIEGIIEYYRNVRREIPEAKLTLVGALIRERLPKSVVLTPGVSIQGNVDVNTSNGRARFGKYIRSSRIFTHISEFDPCPVAVAEAMSAGLPPLISEGVGSKDYVPKELVVKGDFAKHAVKLLEMDQGKIRKISDKCRKLGGRHNKKTTMRNFRRAFSDILAGRTNTYYC